MNRSMKTAVCLLCILVCLGIGMAMAETVAGDLSARFADQITLQYEGKDYRVRQRLTTMLFLGLIDDEQSESETPKVAFMGLVVADDEAKTMSLIQVDTQTMVQFEGIKMRLCDVYGKSGGEAGCIETLQGINGLFPEALIEHYLALDMAGMDAIEGFHRPDTQGMDDEAAIKACLKALKVYVEEECTSDDWSQILSTLSEYIITDMKTGGMMKLADKAERYEVLPTFNISDGNENKGDSDILLWDEEAWTQMLIEIFYEENFW